MSKFVFDEDFAGNWVKGQTVPCEQVDGDYIVDGVAKISAGELMRHGHFEDEQSQVEFTKDGLKAQALNLWQQLNEAELPYKDFVEVQEHIINLFSDIN